LEHVFPIVSLIFDVIEMAFHLFSLVLILSDRARSGLLQGDEYTWTTIPMLILEARFGEIL
jgi:hypothetical protein